MYFIRLFSFLVLLIPIVTFASTYESYEAKELSNSAINKLNEAVSFLKLTPVNNFDIKSLSPLGVNQIYVNTDFSKIIIFKYDVSGKINLNQWEEIESGKVYHYKSDGKINALFVRGVEEQDANKLVNLLRQIHISFLKFEMIFSSKAYAEECDNKSNPIASLNATKGITSSLIYQSILNCATGAKKGAYESTVGTVNQLSSLAWSGLNSLGAEAKSLWTNPKQKMNQYYNGLVKGVLAFKDILTLASEITTNPNKAISTFKKQYGKSADKIIKIFNQIKNLPTPIMAEMACAMLTGIGIDVLIAYLTVGTGSAKLALTIDRLCNQLKVFDKIFNTLNALYKSGEKTLLLSKEKMQLLTRRISENKIPEGDIDFINNNLGQSSSVDKTTMEALACYIK